jgi:hypothetical protein
MLYTKLPSSKLLDFYHVSLSGCLSSIVASKRLIPKRCAVFDANHLYFSYGAPHYRPTDHQTTDPKELPVAFVLAYSIVEKMRYFFPFDTGAMAKGRYGRRYANPFRPLYDFSVTQNPDRLVSCFYEDNARYLRGQVVAQCPTNSAPIPLLHHFLSVNLSHKGIDQRQRTIECIADKPIRLSPSLLWVAYPDFQTLDIAKLWTSFRVGFDSYAYPTDETSNPARLAEHIEIVAREWFRHRYEGPK